jgi:hypothetical protein
MPSLRELQQEFAAALLATDGGAAGFAVAGALGGAARVAIYRRNGFGNYRNALGATYPVVRRLVGAPFFHAAVDAFVGAHPSVSGDLNVYGDAFGAFLAAYPPAAGLPYLPDVARLEWAIDEAGRAADSVRAPEATLATLAAVPPERLAAVRLALDPSCRLVTSPFPIRRIWQVNQPACTDVEFVALDAGPDFLLVRRDPDGIAIERIGAGEHAWLAALADGGTLGAALDAAAAVDPGFALADALRAHLAAGTLAAVARP